MLNDSRLRSMRSRSHPGRAGALRVARWIAVAAASAGLSCAKGAAPDNATASPDAAAPSSSAASSAALESPLSSSPPLESAAVSTTADSTTAPSSAPRDDGPPPGKATPTGPGLPAPAGAEGMTRERLADSYEPIWKAIFMRQNRMSEQEFAKHIKVGSKQIDGSQRTAMLTVIYDVTIGWAKAGRADRLLLKLPPGTTKFPDVPRDAFLGEADIGRILDASMAAPLTPRSPLINRVIPSLRLKFANLDDATKKLTEFAGGASLSRTMVTFLLPKENRGHPCLQAYVTVDAARNDCRRVMLDLVTGEESSVARSCMVH